ncbi:amidohydrolase family protein [Streptomyces sp. NPDC004237]|uniref:amidohydrolase family protein n=1 Tax=Streptomyces sp. NPDC004237 TaxID=3154455 RepID=UPI0033B022CB
MAHIVFSGVLERYPNLKFLIHHGGSMIPHFSGRIGPGWDQLGSRTPAHQQEDVTGYPLTGRPVDYFKMSYADTALFGAAHALRCALWFFGPDRVLFSVRPREGPRLHPLPHRQRGGTQPHHAPADSDLRRAAVTDEQQEGRLLSRQVR